MRTNQKVILASSFLIITALYWILAPIGVWLTIDDSAAVEKFIHDHHLIGAFAGMFWLLEGIGFRYILPLILAITYWWLAWKSPTKTS
jgi:hypothetical protein